MEHSYTVSAEDVVSFRQNLSFHPHITLQLMKVSSLDLCLHYVLTPAPLIFSPLFLLRIPYLCFFLHALDMETTTVVHNQSFCWIDLPTEIEHMAIHLLDQGVQESVKSGMTLPGLVFMQKPQQTEDSRRIPRT